MLTLLLLARTSSPGVSGVPSHPETTVPGARSTIPDSSVTCPPAPDAGNGTPGALATVRYLASDALEGRLAGSPGARCAARYVARHFRESGLEPAGDSGTFFQDVPLRSAVNPHAPGGTGRNVVAILPGSDPALSREAVVVGAHLDHLGRGGFGSLETGEPGQIHNGADDNASGVAALLRAAHRLAHGPRPARSVVFVAFTGEELGLLGSSRYANDPAVPLEHTVAMVNMDMVGRLEDDPLIAYGTGTAQEWEDLLAPAADSAGLTIAREASGFGPSDHTSFYAKQIPVLHFFTNVHTDYHRPGDDWQKIDAGGIEQVAELTARVVRRVADGPRRLTVVTGVGDPPSERSEGYGAYLGTVPDFAPVDRGVRLAGVTDGSPAARAGLRAGDVLVRLGGQDVADLYGFTDALRSHHPGDTVSVTVLREGEARTLTAVLGSRSDRPR